MEIEVGMELLTLVALRLSRIATAMEEAGIFDEMEKLNEVGRGMFPMAIMSLSINELSKVENTKKEN